MTFTLPVQLTEISCGECGGTYAINERYRQQKVDNGGFWTCPYCKRSWGYGESEMSKLRKQLVDKNIEVVRERQKLDQAKAERDNAQKALVASGEKLKRVSDRITNGICPHCNRTFANLASHMKSKHSGKKEMKAEQKRQVKAKKCNH